MSAARSEQGGKKRRVRIELSPVQVEALAVRLGRFDRFAVTDEDVDQFVQEAVRAVLFDDVMEVRAIEDVLLDKRGRGRGQPRKRLAGTP